MSDIINLKLLQPGTKFGLSDGSVAEVVSNPLDGVWVFARYLSSPHHATLAGTEEMIFAQDIVEIRECSDRRGGDSHGEPGTRGTGTRQPCRGLFRVQPPRLYRPGTSLSWNNNASSSNAGYMLAMPRRSRSQGISGPGVWPDGPVILVRGSDGVVRVLLNTCTHRGAHVSAELWQLPRPSSASIMPGRLTTTASSLACPERMRTVRPLTVRTSGWPAPPGWKIYRDFIFISFNPTIDESGGLSGRGREYLDLVCDQSEVGMEIVGGHAAL